MVNYKNAKIYKMVNDELGLTYYGSTCGELRSRLCAHKTQAKTHNITKCTSKLLFEQGSICKIYLVEEFPTDNKMLLLQRERWYIENNDCVNYNVPSRTNREYRSDNKEKISNQTKLYQYKNADKIKARKDIYYQKNKEKIKAQNGLYYQKNNDKINEQNRIYRLKNKDKLKAYNKAYRAKKKLEQSSEPN
jgi:hypothetical protein